MTQRTVKFDRAMAPYEPGDIAGFDKERAQDLVDRSIAFYWPPVGTAPSAAEAEILDILTGMGRAALVAYGREHLGMTDEPAAEVSDADLRQAIRAAVAPEALALRPAEPPPAESETMEPSNGGKPKK